MFGGWAGHRGWAGHGRDEKRGAEEVLAAVGVRSVVVVFVVAGVRGQNARGACRGRLRSRVRSCRGALAASRGCWFTTQGGRRGRGPSRYLSIPPS